MGQQVLSVSREEGAPHPGEIDVDFLAQYNLLQHDDIVAMKKANPSLDIITGKWTRS